jgi:putative acetyltransferase
MLIRAYQHDDANTTRAIFERAVHGSAATHYNREQLDAWAPRADAAGLARWAARRAAAHTVVAVEDGQIAGFSDLVDQTLLDMLFVDPDFGRRGVGSALISAIIGLAQEADAPYVETHASLTARPVFERHGFALIAEERPVIRGVEMSNFTMRLELDSAGHRRDP